MSKHTPGPWQYDGEVKDHFCRIYNAQYRLVAIVPYGSAKNPSKAATPDAMLIAAAPDLLEALKPFAELLKKHHDSMSDDRPIFAIEGSIITAVDLRKAVAAIAKAEGKQ